MAEKNKKPKQKYEPDDLTPPGNLPDKSVIPPGKGIGDDVTELPYKFKSPTKYEPGKKRQPREPENITLYSKGGSLPDLTGDGKITRADVLKGRGVFRKGGSVSSASKRADGIAKKGKTRGKMM